MDRKRTITLKQNEFVTIKDEQVIYYGANQAWYPDKVARKSACGSIAVANIFAYLAITDERYKNLFIYDKKILNKDHFLEYMLTVYQSVKPIHLGNLTIGVPTVNNFKKKALNYARKKNVHLNTTIFNHNWTLANCFQYIEEGLNKNKPIALINGFNRQLRAIHYTKANGKLAKANFDKHWVTITELEHDKQTGKVTITVSSWGAKVKLDLEDVISGDNFKAMIYFE